jgi:hypothetical protein
MVCSLENVRCKTCGRQTEFTCAVHGSCSTVYIARDGTGIYCACPIEDTKDTCLLRLTARCATCEI